MNLLIISCSLSPSSRSRVLARHAAAQIAGSTLLDLRDFDLPHCDGAAAKHAPDAVRVGGLIAGADAVILALPIYNFDVNAAAKNLVELTGRAAWQEKVVAFLCAAGGQSSYMSVMGLANSLMLDFRCLIVPRFVYATKNAFDGETIVDDEVTRRVDELCATTTALAAAVKGAAT